MSEDAFDEAIAALARAEGKTVEQLKREILKEQLASRLAGRPSLPQRVDTGRGRLDPVPGSPIPRHRGQDEDESPEEAQERWYAEEAEMLDGVHGFAGQSAGGIFGDGPIATERHDPNAYHRATARAAQLAQIEAAQAQTRMIGQLGNVVQRLAQHVGLPELPGSDPRQLPGRRRRR